MKTTTRRFAWIAMLALIAAPAVANDVIYSGADHWSTGRTFAHFVEDPLPAGFFCEGSAPFAEQINLKGAPLATEPECVLGSIDTIVHRLDHATFHEDGSASTRIQFLALSLAGMEPLEIPGCGTYDVTASLDGSRQPITEMKIQQDSADGGTFAALLDLNVKMVFTPRGAGEALAVDRNIKLGPGTSSVYSVVPMPKPEEVMRVQVDTDGDLVPDTMLPARTNFAAGNINPNIVPAASTSPVFQPFCYTTNPPPVVCPVGYCGFQSCHCTLDSVDPWEPLDGCRSGNGPGGISICHLHCNNLCLPCDPDVEPIGTLEN